MWDPLVNAVLVAYRTHCDEKDKSGNSYIGHVARVASRVSAGGRALETVAWLHDTIENGGATLAELEVAGFGGEIVAAVDALSRRLNEADATYLTRVLKSGLARRVKRADLADNSDPARLSKLDPGTRDRLTARYTAYEEVLGRYCRTSRADFASYGSADLAWISRWSDDPIEIYERHDLDVSNRAIELTLAACLGASIATPLVRGAVEGVAQLKGLGHRVKSPSNVAERLERSAHEIGLKEVPKDLVRYTVIVDEAAFWLKASAVTNALGQCLDPVRARSFFVLGNPYYGLHTWWRLTGDDLMIEIQVHTERSFRIKEDTHGLYETYRASGNEPASRFRAWEQRVAAWQDYPIPAAPPRHLAGVELQHRRFLAPDAEGISVRSIVIPEP